MIRFIKSATGALISANIAVFVLFHACVAIFGVRSVGWFGLPSSMPWPEVWTPLSYMFTQDSLWNLLFNMLWLYMFSRLFMETARTDGQLLVAYLCGGLGGAIFFCGASAAGLCGGMLFGASAALLGVIVCAAMRVPRMRFMLLFFGMVELRWIAVVAVGLSLLSFASGNPGGGFAHIGGAAGGMAAALILRRRRMRFRILRPGEFNASSKPKTLDELLDKVRRSGYASLNHDERRQLMDYSKRL